MPYPEKTAGIISIWGEEVKIISSIWFFRSTIFWLFITEVDTLTLLWFPRFILNIQVKGVSHWSLAFLHNHCLIMCLWPFLTKTSPRAYKWITYKNLFCTTLTYVSGTFIKSFRRQKLISALTIPTKGCPATRQDHYGKSLCRTTTLLAEFQPLLHPVVTFNNYSITEF